MMTRLTLSLAGLAAFAAPGAAMASDAPANAAKSVCTAANSEAMTIGALIALGDAAIGRCVTIDGWAMHFTLQADNEARYRPQRVYNDMSSTGAILGLYGRNRALDPAVVTVTGRIDSCEAIYERVKASGRIPFLGGFCHYYKGMVVNADVVTDMGTPPITRIAAATAPPDFGNLAPMKAGPARERLAAAFTPLLDAWRNRDAAALKTLLRMDGGAPMSDARLDKLVARLTAAKVSIPRGDAMAVEIFGWREPLWADAATLAGQVADEAGTSSGIVCAATVETAAKRLWPIAGADTSVADDRPYACAHIVIGAGTDPQYRVSIEERQTREPL